MAQLTTKCHKCFCRLLFVQQGAEREAGPGKGRGTEVGEAACVCVCVRVNGSMALPGTLKFNMLCVTRFDR